MIVCFIYTRYEIKLKSLSLSRNRFVCVLNIYDIVPFSISLSSQIVRIPFLLVYYNVSSFVAVNGEIFSHEIFFELN